MNNKFKELISQPSTWRGIILFISGVASIIDHNYAAWILSVGASLSGLVGIFTNDHKIIAAAKDGLNVDINVIKRGKNDFQSN